MALENTNDEACDMVEERTFTSHDVSELVKRGDYILKRKKNAKGSHAWEQFQIVLDANGDKVFGVACCAICETCLLYKKLVNGQEKSMGTKNLLDQLKHCVASQGKSRKDASSASAETSDSGGKSTSIARTLDSFVKRSGKKVNTATKIRFVKELLL